MSDTLLAVRLDGTDVAVPLAHVVEVVRMPELRVVPGAELPLVGVAQVRDSTVRVLDTRVDATGPARDLLVLDTGDALVCDEVAGVLERADIRALDGLPPAALGVLADGTVVVDPLELITRAVAAAGRANEPAAGWSSAGLSSTAAATSPEPVATGPR